MTLVPSNADDRALSFGQTTLRPQDFQPPRVKIVQQMSQEAADGLAKPGDFFNTLTGENFGTSITVAPIQTFMQRILLVREERRGPINVALASAGLEDVLSTGLACRSFDMSRGQGEPGDELWREQKGCDDCPLSQWRKGGDGKNLPPLCTETYNVAGVNEMGELVILSFSKSGAKVGKKFFSAVRMASIGKAAWAVSYEFNTVATRNDQGNFFTPAFRRLSESTPTDVLGAALAWAKEIRGVQINVTPIDEDEAGAPDDTDALHTEGAAF